MPYIPQIKIGNTTYDLKDNGARDQAQAFANAELIEGWVDGKAYRTGSGDIITPGSPVTNGPVSCIYTQCVPYEIFTINLTNGYTGNYRAWCFIDSEGNMLTYAASSSAAGISKYANVELIAPANAAYLVLNASKSEPRFLYKGRSVTTNTIPRDQFLVENLGYTSLLQCLKTGFYRSGKAYVSSITDMPLDYDDTGFTLEVVRPYYLNDTFVFQKLTSGNLNVWERILNYKSSSSTWVPYDGHDWYRTQNWNTINIPIKNTDYKYWNIEESAAVLMDSTGSFSASDPIPVKPGDIFEITARQGATDKARIWTVVDDNFSIIAMAENHNGTDTVTEKFTVPSGGTFLLLTRQLFTSTQSLYKHPTTHEFLTSPLAGRRLSLLGDSMSAYTGTIPSGNAAYYTGSNAGVSSPNQMWWKVLCNKTGMIPLVIDGWSGSAITQLEDSAHVNKTPMSSDTRCGRLHSGDIKPDVIIIAGGTNDYSYAQSAQSEPLEWNGKTAPVLGNSFTEAYACMIKKLQTNYPKAIIVALSTWFVKRGTSNGYTYTHTSGQNVYTLQDYDDKIKFVANRMHIPFIDVSNIGFTVDNYYPTYSEDSATTTTHANALGQHVIGSAIAEKIVPLVKGFFE